MGAEYGNLVHDMAFSVLAFSNVVKMPVHIIKCLFCSQCEVTDNRFSPLGGQALVSHTTEYCVVLNTFEGIQ